MENVVRLYLSPAQIFVAAEVGKLRQIQAIQENFKNRIKNHRGTPWEAHIEGAMGELAVSNHFKMHWSGLCNQGAPDVGDIYDIRTTAYMNGSLWVHEDDKDERFMWLLTGYGGSYILRGGMYVHEAKQKHWWGTKDTTGPKENKSFAFWIPQEHLYFPEGTR